MAASNQWSLDEYRAHLSKKAAQEKAAGKSKYKNKKTEVDGHKFDSKKEADEYLELKRRKLAGDISDFKMQERYKFIINGILVSSYRADFVVIHRNGSQEVIDVKSYYTRSLNDYVIRKKLMQAMYGITIVEK